MKKLEIIIVEDHPLMRHGIRRILESETDITVPFETGNAEEAITYINSNEPDIALIDIELESRASGIELARAISSRGFRTRPVIITMHDDQLYSDRAFRAGAKGFLSKHEAAQKLVEVVRLVAGGQTFTSVSTQVEVEVEAEPDHVSYDNITSFLSNREIEIFEFTGQGYSAGEIASELRLSINTVESHKKNIISKLKLGSSKELLKGAIRWRVNRESAKQ